MRVLRASHLIALLLSVLVSQGLEIYVSPKGKDYAVGTEDQPVSTLSRALELMRRAKLKVRASEPLRIVLLEGSYPVTRSIQLRQEDSGTPLSPLVIAAQKGARVVLSSATSLAPGSFSSIQADSSAWQRIQADCRPFIKIISIDGLYNLRLAGPRYGDFSNPAKATPELWFNGRIMQQARWPNLSEGWARTGRINGPREFFIGGSKAAQWRNASGMRAHGLFKYSWAFSDLEVTGIDAAEGRLQLERQPVFGLEENRPFFVYNILEELDEPGEYVIDYIRGLLYFWPPSALDSAQVALTYGSFPLLLVEDARDLVFENLHLTGSRSVLYQVTNGHRVVFRGGSLYASSDIGAVVDGIRSGLDAVSIYDLGAEGVVLRGGSRASLAKAGNFVTNSLLHHVSRIQRNSHPALHLDNGCGNLVEHNLIEELPHAAIIYDGNEHSISFNEIRRVCRTSSDAGAIYAGCDWGYRGVVIKNNFIHDLHSDTGEHETHGVYLDDLVSGATVVGNLFYDIDGVGVFCGGGRDNHIRFNLIGKCRLGHYNGDYSRGRLSFDLGNEWNLLEKLSVEGIERTREPWLSTYPECARIPNDKEELLNGRWRNPEGTIFSGNLGWDNSLWVEEEDSSGTGVFSVYASFSDNHSDIKPPFTREQISDRSLRSPFLEVEGHPEFPPLPLRGIGPLIDVSTPRP